MCYGRNEEWALRENRREILRGESISWESGRNPGRGNSICEVLEYGKSWTAPAVRGLQRLQWAGEWRNMMLGYKPWVWQARGQMAGIWDFL